MIDRAADLQAPPTEIIRVRGARVHNLRNIDVDIPRDQLVVITGPSGSGKSSLAFDTLFAEGQRQYIESLSTYARQFLNQLERPDVDLIDGLQPTISIDQTAGAANPRSTVATVTEIYDYLRLLYARLGVPYCHACGAVIQQQTPEEIVDTILSLPEGTKAMILAPLVRGRKGGHQEVFDAARKAGFVRVRVDGETLDIDAVPELNKRKTHTIEAVVDRIIVRESVRARIAESVNLAVRHGQGVVGFTRMTDDAGWEDQTFSTEHACPNCKISYAEIEPRTFSFNSPYGACAACEGLGTRVDFDIELVAPDMSRSLADGAIVPWRGASAAATESRRKQLAPLLSKHPDAWTTPLEALKPKVLETLLHGDGANPGVFGILEHERVAAKTDASREKLEAFRVESPCRECGGARLRPEARSVLVGGRAIHEFTAMPVVDAVAFAESLSFPPEKAPIATPLLREIRTRLNFLVKVGLDYLTLDRPGDTLSGGELQRVRLATGIGSGLVGVCYVLDEPSIGLHARDNQRLIEALDDLKQLGNSVLVVEHDEAMMRVADHLIDMGPAAGAEGGQIVAQGTPQEVQTNPESVTGQYLAGARRIAVPATRRPIDPKRAITIENARANNLKGVTARFPLSVFTCITGVSGSGKSSLMNETLARALARKLHGAGAKPGPHDALRGANLVEKLVEIDQSPIGRTPRSNPATYTGVFDEMRKIFATTKEAKLRGYKSGRFSFNIKGGRCEECQGQGTRKIEMNFLPDIYVPCAVCEGKRFNRQTLEIKYRGRSIADCLDMRVDESIEFFENVPAISRVLQTLHDVGLGYLTLGQSSTTLSGGEAQRIKLATELARGGGGSTLYLLDEPTTGLHFQDIERLLEVLNRLVDRGATVIVIEHNLDVIKSADWIIDLGPDGGAAGGYIVAEGTPEQIAAMDDNITGRCLKTVLG